MRFLNIALAQNPACTLNIKTSLLVVHDSPKLVNAVDTRVVSMYFVTLGVFPVDCFCLFSKHTITFDILFWMMLFVL